MASGPAGTHESARELWRRITDHGTGMNFWDKLNDEAGSYSIDSQATDSEHSPSPNNIPLSDRNREDPPAGGIDSVVHVFKSETLGAQGSQRRGSSVLGHLG